MNNKVILISIDGMRPDGLIKCNNPYVDELKKMASYTFEARTVFPRVIEETNGEYTVIVTADHGGLDRAHGSDMYEDMTIPMFFYGPQFVPGREFSGVSILDIAPTIADIIMIVVCRNAKKRFDKPVLSALHN